MNFRIAFLLLFSALTMALSAQPELKFEEQKKNFGFVEKGVVVEMSYKYTNTGTEPLIISDAQVECACTTVEWPRQPLLPGQSANILVKFNTASVYDRQDRSVTILSNARNSPQSIRFKGVVKRPKK